MSPRAPFRPKPPRHPVSPPRPVLPYSAPPRPGCPITASSIGQRWAMGRGGLLLLLLLLMMMMMRAAPRGAEGSCRPQASCEECISSHPRCAWCEEPEFPGGAQMETSRCAPREALERAGCPPGAIVDPHGSLRVLRDTERGDGGGQLRPHSVEMELRAGEELSFAVRFRRARAVPVDLYFLLDLSYSMRDDLQLLQRLGTELLHALHNASSAARIGATLSPPPPPDPTPTPTPMPHTAPSIPPSTPIRTANPNS
uniref:Integrin beta n=1 Tax=Coturnix japonica TaxID=93934 RepID=A0A8C2T5W3_COTJA